MFHMQERQLLLSPLFKKPVHNTVRRFLVYHFPREILKKYHVCSRGFALCKRWTKCKSLV